MMTAIVMLILGPATVFGSLLIRDHFPDKILAALGAPDQQRHRVGVPHARLRHRRRLRDRRDGADHHAGATRSPQVAAHYGYDPIHFGLVFTLAATIGGITPPVGSLLFVACSIGRIGLSEASRAIWPFVVALVLVNALLIVFPALTTVVPSLFFD